MPWVIGALIVGLGLWWYERHRTPPPAVWPPVPSTQWKAGGVPNPNGKVWNDDLVAGEHSNPNVQRGDYYVLVAPMMVLVESITSDNPDLFRVVGSAPLVLPAASVRLTATIRGTATFRATLSDGTSASMTVTVS